jgi:large subunit ribosomal protein L15
MMIHEVTAIAGAHKPRKRVGRGRGSGSGKTSGRGVKGAGSRSGWRDKTAFEGGQMPFFRRLRKRGFTNAEFKTQFWIVNLGDIVAHPDFARGGDVDPARLVAAGLIRDTVRPLKVLGDLAGKDKLSVKLSVSAHRVTASVRKAVEAAGGSVQEWGTRRDHVRGVDLASEERRPTKLTKKLNRGKSKKKSGKSAGATKEAKSEE